MEAAIVVGFVLIVLGAEIADFSRKEYKTSEFDLILFQLASIITYIIICLHIMGE